MMQDEVEDGELLSDVEESKVKTEGDDEWEDEGDWEEVSEVEDFDVLPKEEVVVPPPKPVEPVRKAIVEKPTEKRKSDPNWQQSLLTKLNQGEADSDKAFLKTLIKREMGERVSLDEIETTPAPKLVPLLFPREKIKVEISNIETNPPEKKKKKKHKKEKKKRRRQSRDRSRSGSRVSEIVIRSSHSRSKSVEKAPSPKKLFPIEQESPWFFGDSPVRESSREATPEPVKKAPDPIAISDSESQAEPESEPVPTPSPPPVRPADKAKPIITISDEEDDLMSFIFAHNEVDESPASPDQCPASPDPIPPPPAPQHVDLAAQFQRIFNRPAPPEIQALKAVTSPEKRPVLVLKAEPAFVPTFHEVHRRPSPQNVSLPQLPLFQTSSDPRVAAQPTPSLYPFLGTDGQQQQQQQLPWPNTSSWDKPAPTWSQNEIPKPVPAPWEIPPAAPEKAKLVPGTISDPIWEPFLGKTSIQQLQPRRPVKHSAPTSWEPATEPEWDTKPAAPAPPKKSRWDPPKPAGIYDQTPKDHPGVSVRDPRTKQAEPPRDPRRVQEDPNNAWHGVNPVAMQQGQQWTATNPLASMQQNQDWMNPQAMPQTSTWVDPSADPWPAPLMMPNQANVATYLNSYQPTAVVSPYAGQKVEKLETLRPNLISIPLENKPAVATVTSKIYSIADGYASASTSTEKADLDDSNEEELYQRQLQKVRDKQKLLNNLISEIETEKRRSKERHSDSDSGCSSTSSHERSRRAADRGRRRESESRSSRRVPESSVDEYY